MKRRVNGIYLALVVLLTLAVAGGSLPGVHAQSPNRVGLVVRFGDGSHVTRCVEFSEPQISGYDVLMRSGLNVVAAYFSGEGTAICAIESTGCPVGECLTCDYPNYWAYWHLVDGAWAYSQAGASGYTVHPGDVEGWSWGAGEPPPVVPFDQICAPPATDTPPPPTNTPPPPTDTPPLPTATPLPTNTPPPSTATLLPTATPLPSTATSPPPTPMVWFRLDANPIPAGDCTMARWDTANASEVYLDGERVDANGSREVCPSTPQEYHLRVVSVVGEQTHTLALGMTGVSSAPTLTPGPTGTPAPTLTPGPTSDTTMTPTPTQCPTHTPMPATPVATANRPVTPSPQPVAQVTTPTGASRQPTTQPTAQPSNHPTTQPNPTGYIIFGVIAVGLLAWLVFGLLRRR